MSQPKTDAAAAVGPRDLDDRVEDDPRLASLPETDAAGLTEAEATRRRSLGMGNDTVIRFGRAATGWRWSATA